MKGNVFLILGKICQKEKNYDFAIKLYKKSLQYAWFSEDTIRELEIYDYIGMCFYYQGEMKKAYKYHERYFSNLFANIFLI